MSIEMKHAERLQQSINALQDGDGPRLPVRAAGCGTILAVPFLLLAVTFLALSYAAIVRCAAMMGG